MIQEPNWDTIDMVKHGGHLYSSKPPLLPTLMAAVYWPIYRLSGASLGTHPYEIGRIMLVVFNLLPLLAYFLLLAGLGERFGTTDWGRLFTFAAATFGTLLTTFAVAINNHLPAAVCTAAAIYAAIGVVFDGQWRLRHFILAGLFGSLAAACEFPAAALLAVLGAVLLWKDWRATLCGFLPAVIVVAAAFFGTNWIAHGSLKPAYLHNSGTDNWYDYTYQRNGREVESYWRKPAGIDRGEPSPKIYALNVLVGHHGIFSLTPVWLLSLVGMFLWMWPRRAPADLLPGRGDLPDLGRLRDVLSAAAAVAPQLRRRQQRSALGVLARAAVAVDDAARRRRLGPAEVDPRALPGAVGPLGPLRQLPDLEPLDGSLADGLLAVFGPSGRRVGWLLEPSADAGRHRGRSHR